MEKLPKIFIGLLLFFLFFTCGKQEKSPELLVGLGATSVIALRREDVPDLKLSMELFQTRRDGKKLSFLEALTEQEKKAGFVPNAELSTVSDAWTRQVYKAGIDLKSSASLVEQFFSSDSNRVLFPEYIRRKIEEGMRFGKRYLNPEDVYGVKTELDGVPGMQQSLIFDEDKTKLALIAQGSEFPNVSVNMGEKPIVLFKAGRKVTFTYEALRRSSLLRAGLFFSAIGNRIGRQITKRALEVIEKGDGNAAALTPKETATTTWKYSDVVQFLYGDFDEGYEPSHVIVNRKFFVKIFTDNTNFPQFQSPGILEKFLRTGEQEDLLGVIWKIHPDIPDDTIFAFNKKECLEYYEEKNSAIVETDKIISNQTEIGTISRNLNFGIIDAKARGIKKLKA
ncbi:MAG: hypothetical protein H7A25_22230 [Leptospiraceae bacterium]|nr:hypothetical protein [Leptospiraceae bacterium]MCP5502632.1 hypothetical protein [Leptospiraceae bacterium]